MLLSKYFLPLFKERPANAELTSHALMLRAGLIHQHSSGIYNWLPLGLKVLRRIESIVRFNMNKAGFIEMLMPCIQDADLWKKSGRFDAYGKEMLKIKDRHNKDLVFGPTHEEVITEILKNHLHSYKELPKVLYQIQWKFRDEIRPRFGVMRGREFLMKDAYSFDIDEDSAIRTYNKVFDTYIDTFRDMGLQPIPIAADSGEIGGSLNHEFHVVADSGESLLFYDKRFESQDITLKELKSLYTTTKERYNADDCPIDKDQLISKRGIEIGHIFNFQDKYSKPMNLVVNDGSMRGRNIQMGSYGIGLSRLVAAIIEVNHDNNGIIWPLSVAPFKVSLINLSVNDEKSNILANDIYRKLNSAGFDILYDDTKDSAGKKFATHDLIGSPWQIIVGARNSASDQVELKNRKSGEMEKVDLGLLISKLMDSIK